MWQNLGKQDKYQTLDQELLKFVFPFMPYALSKVMTSAHPPLPFESHIQVTNNASENNSTKSGDHSV